LSTPRQSGTRPRGYPTIHLPKNIEHSFARSGSKTSEINPDGFRHRRRLHPHSTGELKIHPYEGGGSLAMSLSLSRGEGNNSLVAL
ncbi:MAG TPA: hypothetical protein VFC78_16635, partial [Tepidisphaeraceae bacterium]|nr:hypothetical protein [Tepidisphaeraceae bacterium]